jgi:hypothetical protein
MNSINYYVIFKIIGADGDIEYRKAQRNEAEQMKKLMKRGEPYPAIEINEILSRTEKIVPEFTLDMGEEYGRFRINDQSA